MAELTEAELHELLDRIEDRLRRIIEELVTFLAEMKQGRRDRPDIDWPRTDLDPDRPMKARPTPEDDHGAGREPPPPSETVESLPAEPPASAGTGTSRPGCSGL